MMSLQIENFHQLAGKCWKEECVPSDEPLEIEYHPKEEKKQMSPVYLRPGPLYEANRLAGLGNKVPQRHKYKSSDDSLNKNVPQFFVVRDKNGMEHYLSYVNSRQWYCGFFDRLASQQSAFKDLVEKRASGINLRICGYDAFDMKADKESIHAEYLSGRVPFGHERVLLTMLVLPECDWPWRVYKTFDF
jgi:hypothetical protein